MCDFRNTVMGLVSKKTRRSLSAMDARGHPSRIVRHRFVTGSAGLAIQCEGTGLASLAVAALADAELPLPDNRIPPSA